MTGRWLKPARKQDSEGQFLERHRAFPELMTFVMSMVLHASYPFISESKIFSRDKCLVILFAAAVYKAAVSQIMKSSSAWRALRTARARTVASSR